MKNFNKHYHPPGTPPGTLMQHNPQGDTFIRLIEYSEGSFTEINEPTLEHYKAALNNNLNDWLDITGAYSPQLLSKVGEIFGLHPLALEDVLNSGQRPKVDFHEKHVFIVLSLPYWSNACIKVEQVSLFVGEHYVISFCSGTGEALEPVRQRLRQHIGRLRSRSIAYLVYTLVDVVIDSAFPLLETVGEQIEVLEDQILSRANQKDLNTLHDLKRELLLLRRHLWPQREVVSRLLQHDGELINENLRPYFSDCYDHAVQIIDLIETYREMLGGMLDIYLSSLSNRMNDIMRILTIISTIFIPLTFLVGVYGMNFSNMPELHWHYGYFILWGVMLSIAVGLLILFRWKKWL